jgi:hypothetical protein
MSTAVEACMALHFRLPHTRVVIKLSRYYCNTEQTSIFREGCIILLYKRPVATNSLRLLSCCLTVEQWTIQGVDIGVPAKLVTRMTEF